ncbi:YfcE family phosphodiesterase [Ignatzschineria rhizosphaerae]|uniref:Phosphoesterase n=1 Tax=Ignatzschineria rhizosphaerae TaxID=2923279 RepID=A0ABY3X3H8_9GAMM|nr:YfcE family phosphodiesterase [Ignatzschineria rhizosphaerae]UNM97437.1 YfcE family phosphodiesterase [Ignatzschineria rhizosphaerae]
MILETQGKVLVLSDSHGDVETMLDIIGHWENELDAVIFTGDGAEDLVEAAFIFKDLSFYAVTGNNDRMQAPNSRVNFPLENELVLFGRKIYVTHGHIATYALVKQEVLRRALLAEASIALYGHLHIPEVYIEDNIARFNSGSIAYPRGSSDPSYLILDISAHYLGYQFFHAKSHQKRDILV